MDSEAT
ncbi:hypothetical protein CGCSCA5_v012235 [Colletotrichum siamense]|nr:hypothetical protein CGCSCA5_v012235 [Colletotrichum siamense]